MAYKNHTQPIGYINDRLNENTCEGAFKATQLAAWVVDPNNPTDRGTHPEFLPARLTKTDALDCAVGSVVCYQKTISGFDTIAAREYNDTAQIVDETSATVYMRKVQPFESGPVIWAHVPNHKIEEAAGDPYAVQFVWVARWGQYTHAFV